MGLGYWKIDNIYLLVSQFVNVIKNLFVVSEYILEVKQFNECLIKIVSVTYHDFRFGTIS